MTNDTTTLNGALTELSETLASNINNKGISASATDGLTTLANKVSNIPNINKKTYSLGAFTYNPSYINVNINDDFWIFSCLQKASRQDAMVLLNGTDFVSTDSNAVVSLSFTIGAIGSTVGQFAMAITTDDDSFVNSTYYNKNTLNWYGTAKTGTTDNPQELNQNDVIKYVADIKNCEVRIYANNTLLATRVMISSVITDGQLKIVFILTGTTFSHAIKDIEYKVER